MEVSSFYATDALVSLSLDTAAAILLLIAFLGGCLVVSIAALSRIARLPVVLLLCIIGGLACAAWLRLVWIPAHHAMYVDEPWYLEAARNLIHRGALSLCQREADAIVCTPYLKAAGWPVVLAAAFAIFGAGSQVAFAVSAALATAAVWLAAVVVRLAGGSRSQAAFAALLIAIHPLHVAWSATAETNAASTAVLLAGVAGVLRLRRAPSFASALLAGGGIGLAAAMRPEMAMIVPPALLALVGARSAVRVGDAIVVVLGGIMGASSVLASWALYISNSSGTFLSPDNLGPNIVRLLTRDQGGPLTIALVVLSMFGAIALWRRREIAVLTLLLGGAMLIALVAVGYDERIFYPRTILGSVALLIPLAALGLPGVGPRRWWSGGVLESACAIAIALSVPSLRAVHDVSETQILETRLSQAVAGVPLPADAVVIAEWPTILGAETDIVATPARTLVDKDTGLKGLSAAIDRRPHFLLCDMFCESGDLASGAAPACAKILTTFELQEVTSVSNDHRRYGLYRLARRAGPNRTRPPCPLR